MAADPPSHLWVYSSQHFLKLRSSLIPEETSDCDPALLAVAKLQSEILQIWHWKNKYLLVRSLQKVVRPQMCQGTRQQLPRKLKHMSKLTWSCVLSTQRRIHREDQPKLAPGCYLWTIFLSMGNLLLLSPELQTFNFHRNGCYSVLVQALSLTMRLCTIPCSSLCSGLERNTVIGKMETHNMHSQVWYSPLSEKAELQIYWTQHVCINLLSYINSHTVEVNIHVSLEGWKRNCAFSKTKKNLSYHFHKQLHKAGSKKKKKSGA